MPSFLDESGYLPAGEHGATWAEVLERFGWNQTRRAQLDGLADALRLLARSGCTKVWLNGSFVTAKDEPGDFDAVWGSHRHRRRRPRPDLLRTVRRAAPTEAALRRRVVPNWINFSSDSVFAEFFQQDRYGNTKGIIVIDPREVLA
jgi:hypothetical protein